MGYVARFGALMILRVLLETPTAETPRPQAALDNGSVVEEACKLGQELREAYLDVRAAHLNLWRSRKYMIPDMHFKTDNPLQEIATRHGDEWVEGLHLNEPLTFRRARADIRFGKEILARYEAVFEARQVQMQRFLRHQVQRLCSWIPFLHGSPEEIGTYSVQGAVIKPGTYPIVGRETVLDAIAAAGGLAHGSACDFTLVRTGNQIDGWQVLFVDFKSLAQCGDPTTDYLLQPGDVLVVAQRAKKER